MRPLFRRLRGVAPLVGMVALVICPARAQVPLVKTQAPGFYRMMLGDFEITALNDGVVAYPVSTLTGATPEQITSGLAEMRLTAPVNMSYNAFLINTGTRLNLIDTGTGGTFAESPFFRGAGRLLANLRAAGYRPEQVDDILITHIGPDHVGGLTHGANRAFPHAMVRAARSEVDVYLDPAKAAAAIAAAPDKEQAKAWFQFQERLLAPYVKEGKFRNIDADGTIVPGVRSLATHGHTPGHTSFIVESKGQTMIVLGDLVHWGAVQFAYPSASTSFDSDPASATAQRQRVFQMAADGDYWVAGAHLAFPGVGHIRAGEGRYFWIPATYTIPR